MRRTATLAGLSPTDAATMVKWTREDVASGKLSPEQAAKIFDDLNVPAEQRTAPVDVRSNKHKFVDQHFPIARPEEYQIRYADPGQVAPPMSAEMSAFDQSARAWLSGAEFTRELGNSLISTIERVAQQTMGMTPDQLETYGYVEFEKLERAYGTTLDDKLNAAGRMVEALEQKTPGLKNLLRRVGDSALLASLLIQQSERYWARRR